MQEHCCRLAVQVDGSQRLSSSSAALTRYSKVESLVYEECVGTAGFILFDIVLLYCCAGGE